ncbi:MAG: EAL domain-containing protein [Thermoleophilaceae bacterium]|nr:EAL domain-containing protein [Thermoleophilaceae bacterium]
MEAPGPTTERRQAHDLEQALAESENRFRCLIEYARDAYLLYDESGRVLDANASACETYGYARSELLGRSVADLFDDTPASALTELDDELCGGRARTLEVVGRRREGETFPAEVRVGVVDSRDGRLFMALVRDVSERERSERQIEYLGEHDALTGLPNCTFFTEQVRAAVERAQRDQRRQEVAVLHVDLNRFTLINQGLGSRAGDELLRQTASRLREAAEPMDVVARYSADEFLVLVPDVETAADGQAASGMAAAQGRADEIHRALARPFDIDNTEVYVDASVGISVFPLDADEPPLLLRNASAAAQQAKRPGEGPTKLFAGETSDKWARLWLATRLRKAVERGELLLHYQPIVDLRPLTAEAGWEGGLDGRIVAVEALARWRTDRGLVPPASFIPLAEDIGMIEAIGEWVAGEACRQALVWRDAGTPLDVSVNLSLHELWQPSAAQRVGHQVAQAGLEPGSVIIEVTESSAMTDPVRTQRVLGELRRQGFRLAIDDFGAGHSSLARLSEFPCEILKIDRSFVARLPEDPTAAAMVTAMIELARGLGLQAVAEGIETGAQLAFLVERRCALGQGFLFSRPVPGEEIPRL